MAMFPLSPCSLRRYACLVAIPALRYARAIVQPYPVYAGPTATTTAGGQTGHLYNDFISCTPCVRPSNLQNKMDHMKLATWNVNSLRVRLPQVLDWLQANPVHALCLQELKLADDKFPLEAFTEIGYQAQWAGQKTYNGVAIIGPAESTNVQRNIPGFDDPQQRIVAVTVESPIGDIRVISAYCPNGQSVGSDKYEYKLAWYAALQNWLADELKENPRLAILGDYNVAPTDEDVHDPAKWEGDILVSPAEREALSSLLGLGLTDAFRMFPQEEKSFTWWDYRRFAYRRNAGLRIDHILLSDALVPYCTSCVIDKQPRGNEQPSDHTPVVATLDFTQKI